MNTPNANKVCSMFWSYTYDCKNCPIKEERSSKPKDPSHPTDWEEQIEKAATEYLSQMAHERNETDGNIRR